MACGAQIFLLDYFMISWLERHILPCAYKSLFGIDCPGCGIQRSFIQLLKGDLSKSFMIYPPLIPVISWLVFSVLYFAGSGLVSRNFLKLYSIGVLIFVLTNYF